MYLLPRLQFFYKPMLTSDCLIEVLQNSQNTSSNTIRKALFDVTVNGQLYPDTCCILADSALVFRLKVGEDHMLVKVKFSFDLLFQVVENQDENNVKGPHSIMLQRNYKKVTVTSHKNLKQLSVWVEFFQKNLNQRGFHSKFKGIKKIGRGNFATVYLVSRVEDESRCVVKSFSKELLYAEEKGKESLVNEISLMRKFSHNNLMKLEGVYETDHSIYLVLQLVEGGQLSQKIAKKQKLSTLEVKMIMKSLLEGLDALHKKNVMHRDLKPQNILLRKENDCECVIADFGLAEQSHADEYLFVRCGTPGFVAPEVANLKDYKAKYTCTCDMFSLGIIFHMLLLKKSPFPGKEYNQILCQNRACNFNFDSYEYRQLPEASLHLLQKLLEKDPAKRLTANDALKHAFFYSQFTIWEDKTAKNAKLKEDNRSSIDQSELELSMARSKQRKKVTHIRGDSCLKFKMKENVIISKMASQESGTSIASPELNAVTFRAAESRFKKSAIKHY